MSLFARLISRWFPPTTTIHRFPPQTRSDILQGFDASTNSDIISGYQFCATLQLRTPLRVLERHGEFHKGVATEPPQICRESWEGIWVPRIVTFREMGIDVDEPGSSTMASDVGQVPQDGGDYLKFLLLLRRAAEGGGSLTERRAAVASLLDAANVRHLVQKLGGNDAVLDRLFPPFVSTVQRIPEKVASGLFKAGYASPAAILNASQDDLRSVGGVGIGLIALLREAALTATEPNETYVDNVLR